MITKKKKTMKFLPEIGRIFFVFERRNIFVDTITVDKISSEIEKNLNQK